MIDIRLLKNELRQAVKLRRAGESARNPAAALKLRDMALQNLAIHPNSTVASYCAFDSEIDPTELAESLRKQGHIIALPVVAQDRQPLIFRSYQKGDDLQRNSFGIAEPKSSATEVLPDVLLVPLVAFDRQRHRLGYGGGFYDRTIIQLRGQKHILAIGLAFACQEVPEVPKGKHDVQLDKIVTEIQIF